jgi:hypothetical protein
MFPPRPLSPIALCSLYSPLSPLRPSALSMAHCPLVGTLSSLWHSVSSTAVCPPLKPYVLSLALCPLYCPMSPLQHLSPLWPLFPLRPSVLSMPSVSSTTLFPSMTICPLGVPLSSLRPYVSLYNPLSLLWPSVSSTSLCPLDGPLSPLKNSETSETTLLFREMFCKMHFVKTPRVIAIYFV